MKLHVLTASGSHYVIDDTSESWCRIEHTPVSGALRTDGTGPCWCVATRCSDRALLITGPPVRATAYMRLIVTTPIECWWTE